MHIVMSGLEHSLAPIHLRERLSFTKAQTMEMVQKIRAYENVSGCVLISTCNRTELYISCEENTLEPAQLLCKAADAEYEPYKAVFVTRCGDEAIHHLMEVAAGLRSRIWGEDQIISQVKDAIAIARKAGTSDSVLETLFRSAITAGKEVRTRVRLTALPTSAASMAVDLLQQKLGSLEGKRAIVIGNGEMGRLSASLLHKAGCHVAVTLRTYRHGQTIVPPGCGVIPYEERFEHMDGIDLLISATTSPHYTVTVHQLSVLKQPPKILVDLAIPRDIQPKISEIENIHLYNVDDLGDFVEHREVPAEVTEILNTHLDNFYRWFNYKECMTSVDSLKQAIIDRILTAKEWENELSEMEIIELSVNKTVDLLVGGLADRVEAKQLTRCESKIRAHTTGRPAVSWKKDSHEVG